MTLKAFAVLEKEENTGGIIFATRDITARKAGANEYADGDIRQVTCRRAPWADQYAGGKVPVRVQVENGWHYECSGCDIRIDEDLHYRYEDELPAADDPTDKGGDDLPLYHRYNDWTPARIVEDGSLVFCTSECQESFRKERAAIKAEEQRHVDRLKRFLARRFPNVEFLDQDGFRTRQHVYCRRDRDGKIRVDQVHIPFAYPGMKYGPGDLSFERRTYRTNARRLRYSCAGGDVESFREWLRQQNVRQRHSNPAPPKNSPGKN